MSKKYSRKVLFKNCTLTDVINYLDKNVPDYYTVHFGGLHTFYVNFDTHLKTCTFDNDHVEDMFCLDGSGFCKGKLMKFLTARDKSYTVTFAGCSYGYLYIDDEEHLCSFDDSGEYDVESMVMEIICGKSKTAIKSLAVDETNPDFEWFYCENCFGSKAIDMSAFKAAAESLVRFEWNKKGMFASLPGFICPHCGCPHSTFHIDLLMIPTVRALNEKGYITKACCSGHEDSSCFHTANDEAYVFLEHAATLEKYLNKKRNDVWLDIYKNFIDFMIEIEYGDGIENVDGIVLRARFNPNLSDAAKDKLDTSFLSMALFSSITNFPENEDELRMRKYTYFQDDGTPYKDNKEEE